MRTSTTAEGAFVVADFIHKHQVFWWHLAARPRKLNQSLFHA